MTNNTQHTTGNTQEATSTHPSSEESIMTLRARCEGRHQIVNQLMAEFKYYSAIREIEEIIKIIKEA